MGAKQQIVVDVVETLQQVHNAFASGDKRRMAAAESVLSALILHLRDREAIMPGEVQKYLDRL